VELPLVYRGVSARKRRTMALDALKAVGLAERVYHTPNQLSGGQQQRVAIARALVTGPPMLLADEPTGNLDSRTSLEVLALLQRLNRERGITIVLVTHEQDIAACASRVVTFRDGRIVSDVKEQSVDAVAELAKLPPPEASIASSSDEDRDPAAAEKRRLGGPVPRALYVAMGVASAFGLVAGNLYTRAILDIASVPIPLAFAFAFEALAGAWYARRSLGRPLSNDQRVRVSLTYTLGVTALVAPLTALGWMPWSRTLLDRLEGLSSSQVVLALFVTLLGIGALALARYLVLALVAPIFLAPRTGRKGVA
jgi:putative ABC transport system ATP-binding protein